MSYLVLVWQLICFKKGPQDLPWSALLLVLLELATVVLITPANHEVLHVLAAEQLWSHSSWPAALALSFIQQSLYLVFAYLLLQKLNKAERWLKSMLALASSQVFLLVLLLLVSKLALPFLSFVLNIWSLAVAGHIYRHYSQHVGHASRVNCLM